MQRPEYVYYPFINLIDLQHYLPQIPHFYPQIHYNSDFQKYRSPEPERVKIIIPKLENAQNSETATKLSSGIQLRAKKIKQQSVSQNNINKKLLKLQDNSPKHHKSKPLEQKEGRNANSNLLRMFFRRLYNKIQEHPHHILFIIKKFQMKITLHQFIQWLKLSKVDYRNYIRLPSIKKLFEGHRNTREHAKIMRILLKQFIDSEAINCYWTSKKLRKDIMMHNYHSIRNIFKEIFQSEPASTK